MTDPTIPEREAEIRTRLRAVKLPNRSGSWDPTYQLLLSDIPYLLAQLDAAREVKAAIAACCDERDARIAADADYIEWLSADTPTFMQNAIALRKENAVLNAQLAAVRVRLHVAEQTLEGATRMGRLDAERIAERDALIAELQAHHDQWCSAEGACPESAVRGEGEE